MQGPAIRHLAVGVAASLVLAAGAFALAERILFSLTLGPVALGIDAVRGHGIHVGDVLAIPLVALGFGGLGAASLLLRRLVQVERRQDLHPLRAGR